MARRIGDPALPVVGRCSPRGRRSGHRQYAEVRLALAQEGLRATRAAGDLDAEAVALVVLTGSLLEMGDLDGVRRGGPGDRAARDPAPQHLRADGAGLARPEPGLRCATTTRRRADRGRALRAAPAAQPGQRGPARRGHPPGLAHVGRADRGAVEPLTAAIAVADERPRPATCCSSRWPARATSTRLRARARRTAGAPGARTGAARRPGAPWPRRPPSPATHALAEQMAARLAAAEPGGSR